MSRIRSAGTPGAAGLRPEPSGVGTAGAGDAAASVADAGSSGDAADSSRLDGLAWRDFSGAGGVEARILGLSTPSQTPTGLVDFAWDKPGDAVAFELSVEVTGDPRQVKAELWTNANHNDRPGEYVALPMALTRTEGRVATYRLEVPIEKLGNYRATARVSVDGGRSFSWASACGVADVRFRPRDEAHDALNFMEVNVGNVNHDPTTGRYGTFADMMEPGSPETNGRYTLEWLAAQGKTAIWLQPPFEVNKWEYRHPLDDAGSPYAVKDYFSIRAELARGAQGLSGEAARDAAMAEFRAFVDQAHGLGIKVILDVALNHVGHNYDFRDLFVRYDQAGGELREVRKDDYSNVAPSREHLEVIERRLADPNVPDYMEWVAPWMYGASDRDPHGADSVHEKAAGGWGQWHDVAQLNHGGYFGQELGDTPENRAVRDWLGRVLRFWAVDMQTDGFRLDHLTGLPVRFVEEAFNLAQADVDRHRPGHNLYVMGEDFHNVAETQNLLDSLQGGWFHEIVKVRTPAHLQRVFEDPWFQRNLINLSSHDEPRFFNAFGDDHRAATRLACLLELCGGTVMELAGDEFGERQQLQFKQYRGLPALRSMDAAKKEIARTFRRAGQARKKLTALQDDNRAWLRPLHGGADPDLVSLARVPDAAKTGEPVFVLANLSNSLTRENAFHLDDATRARIEPDRRYQVYDLMADDSFRPLWDPPLSGRDLLERGLFARLRPYQIQALRLEALD